MSRVPRCNRGAGEGEFAGETTAFDSLYSTVESIPLNLTFSSAEKELALPVRVLSVLCVLVVVDELVNNDLLAIQIVRNVGGQYRC